MCSELYSLEYIEMHSNPPFYYIPAWFFPSSGFRGLLRHPPSPVSTWLFDPRVFLVWVYGCFRRASPVHICLFADFRASFGLRSKIPPGACSWTSSCPRGVLGSSRDLHMPLGPRDSYSRGGPRETTRFRASSPPFRFMGVAS